MRSTNIHLSEKSTSEGETSGDSSSGSKRDKGRVGWTSLILWNTHQNDVSAVRKLLEEDWQLVNARDYDSRTPLHVAALQGWIDMARCLIEHGADVNAQDRWKNTPLADAEGAKKYLMIELLKSYGGLSYGQNGSHSDPKPVLPPLPNKCDWEIDPAELDFSTSTIIGKGSFGEIVRANWRGTPVAVKRILPSLSEDKLVTQDFRHEVSLLLKLRHPNIVQFLGAVTERKPLMLVTEFLRGGDLHQYLKEKGAISPAKAITYALDIARGMAYLHKEPNVIIHRDLKPRNILLVNSTADHLKVGDFGLSKPINVKHANDIYKLTGETGSYRYMAPEVFKHRKYDKKVDVFSFAMILYEILEGEPPLPQLEPYEAAKYVADGHRPMFRSKGCIPELKELIEHCWSADVVKRPSFLDILKRLERTKESISSDHHWHLFST
ncbi:hypothetical protein LUZ63_008034 [Rhynchospora breviuscula]|uniref:non-specific serine/threonine protein kinase n=1 Tax=Rhynchospora breviuscula TaxID=2022672 RepID=A0A9Q0HUY0_9POAL|nr:hypothetical protein LUZ63_008034 [Rhynchospora breviuscula]